ncbi:MULTISPECIES: V-type ATP synthase subunit I [Terrabacteria group]|uniref:V-type ATP synthase subunit I n=1 Tax=Bacillati TaxID=1783272 RepID=UPI001C6E0302|nr:MULTISPECIES: V-type ATPase 116kDa subunit family protein [Terrabacteria group]MBW9212315.1 hypothetical protein [Trueperella sp. zg.1013]
MAIEKMKYVSLSCSKSHLNEMLEMIGKSQPIHPILASQLVEDKEGVLLNEENPYDSYAQSFQNIGHMVGCVLKEKEPTGTYSEAEIQNYIAELNHEFGLDTNGEVEILSEDDEKALHELAPLGFERMKEAQYLNFGLGRLPLDSYKKISLYAGENFSIHKLHSNNQYVWLVYVTSDAYLKRTQKIFHSLFFEPIQIPAFDREKRVQECRWKMMDVYSYCLKQSSILKLYPYVLKKDERYEFDGFVPARKIQSFKALFKDVSIQEKEPSEVSIPCPTILRNNWFTRPFELFVEMYGLPKYDDFDPTSFVAVTYSLIFGIMFGDLGQGLVLAILGFLLEKKAKLFGIIARVGVTSSIFGFLYGSVFGLEEVLNPIHQQIFNVREKLLDVMDGSNTMGLLISAVLLGASLILITMLMNIWNNARHKRWIEVFLSQNGMVGFGFYGFILVAIGARTLYGISLTSLPFMIVFVYLPLLCFLLKERFEAVVEGHSFKPSEGWLGYVVQNFFEVFEILLSFVTNSLSYLRVGGFILSHAGMMLVVMTLMKMTGTAGIVVFIIGNIFVMGLEGLIVGIQTLRLEYYEMFSRYYTGGGTKFVAYSTKSAD